VSSIDWAKLQKEASDATKVLPDGDYPIEVEKAESVLSSNGNPQIKYTLRVTDGQFTGRKLFGQLTLSTEKAIAMNFFFQGLAGLGVDSNVLAGGPSMEQIAAAIVGRQATATVGHGPYQGQDRNQVKTFQPAGPGVMQGAVVIAAELGSGVPSTGGPSGPPSAGVSSATPSGPPVPSF